VTTRISTPDGRDDLWRYRPAAKAKGSNTWNPYRSGQTILADIHRIISDAEAQEVSSLTARQFLYAATSLGEESARFRDTGEVWDKSDYRHAAQMEEFLLKARRGGKLAWSSVDDGRTQSHYPDEHESVEQFWEQVRSDASSLTLTAQHGQESVIELHVEARGTVNQVVPLAESYGVMVGSSGGFHTAGSLYRTAQRIARRAVDHNLATTLLHIGDHDRAGVDAFLAFHDDVVAHLDTTFTKDEYREKPHPDGFRMSDLVVVERVALLPSQVDDGLIPDRALSEVNADWTDWDWPYSAQLEALPVPTLLGLVEEAIRRHQDEEVREARITETERARIEVAATIDGLLSQ
jgi:hypothetical protein